MAFNSINGTFNKQFNADDKRKYHEMVDSVSQFVKDDLEANCYAAFLDAVINGVEARYLSVSRSEDLKEKILGLIDLFKGKVDQVEDTEVPSGAAEMLRKISTERLKMGHLVKLLRNFGENMKKKSHNEFLGQLKSCIDLGQSIAHETTSYATASPTGHETITYADFIQAPRRPRPGPSYAAAASSTAPTGEEFPALAKAGVPQRFHPLKGNVPQRFSESIQNEEDYVQVIQAMINGAFKTAAESEDPEEVAKATELGALFKNFKLGITKFFKNQA